MKTSILPLMSFVALLSCFGSTASAALVTYSPAQSLFAAGNNGGFISTTGTLVLALNARGDGDDAVIPPATGGPITFVAGTSGSGVDPQGSNVTVGFNGAGTPSVNNSVFGDGFFSGSAEIQDLLQSAVFGVNEINVSGLTDGATYEIQIFGHDGRSTRNVENRIVGFSDGTQSFDNSASAGTAGFFELNNRSVADGGNVNNSDNVGDSIIGTFVADASGTLTIETEISLNNGTTFVDNNALNINGLQIRQIAAPQLVPEPSSLAFLLVGALSLCVGRRRR